MKSFVKSEKNHEHIAKVFDIFYIVDLSTLYLVQENVRSLICKLKLKYKFLIIDFKKEKTLQSFIEESFEIDIEKLFKDLISAVFYLHLLPCKAYLQINPA